MRSKVDFALRENSQLASTLRKNNQVANCTASKGGKSSVRGGSSRPNVANSCKADCSKGSLNCTGEGGRGGEANARAGDSPHLCLKIGCGANGSKGSLTADALAADLPFLSRLTMHSSAQSQPCRKETVYSNGGKQGTNEAPAGSQIATHLHSQSFQGLLTHLHKIYCFLSSLCTNM